MTEELLSPVEQSEEVNAVLELARKLFLASVGAFMLAQESVGELVDGAEHSLTQFLEDVEAFIEKLVERGEIAEKDGRQLLTDLLERRKAAGQELVEGARGRAKEAETAVTGRMEELVARLNIPTREDLEALTKKITTLGRKVDKLQKLQVDEPAQTSMASVLEDAEEAVADAVEAVPA